MKRDGNSRGSLAMQVTAVVSQFASRFKSEGEPGSGACGGDSSSSGAGGGWL